MKKEVFSIVFGLAIFMFVLSSVVAYDVVVQDISPTLSQVKIVNATELYSYEINFITTDASPTIDFYGALAINAQQTTSGQNVEDLGSSTYLLSVYESILDSNAIGVNLSDDFVFNITHTGNLTLRQQINVFSSQTVQQEQTVNICTESDYCTEWTTCSNSGYQERNCTSPVCHYWNGIQTSNRVCTPNVVNTPVTRGGGGGGGGTVTQALTIEFGTPDIQETGKINVPVTIKNDGGIDFSDITINGYLKKNGEVLTNTEVGLTKSSIATLTPSSSVAFTASADIRENDVNFYELVIAVKSKTPAYNVSNRVLFTFIGVEGGKVLKVVAFTEGLITEHPECLELKDMIVDAQTEFDQGNTQLALQKANQAVDACKSYLESPLKPIVTQKQYDRIPLYLGIGITAAILLGIIFNIYRSYRFRR